MNNDWVAYVPYYGDNIVEDFNLKESEHIKLYNIKEDKGINHIHYHYSELIAAYYVWKNQIKSDYICLWDHRRFLTPINFNKLDNDMIQTYYHGYTELTPFEYMIKDGINEYIIYQFIKYMIEVKHVDHDTLIDKIYRTPWYDHIWYHSCFNCNWKVFNDICEFVFGFLSYMMPNGNYEDQHDCDIFIEDLQRSFNIIESKYKDGEMFTSNGRIKSGDRDFANTFEMLLPLYCDLIWNGTFHEIENKHIVLKLYEYDENLIVQNLKKWISKNAFTGCREFIIITSNNKKDNLQAIVNYHHYELASRPVRVIDNNELSDLNHYILLGLNQYIDSNSPVDDLKMNNIRTF